MPAVPSICQTTRLVLCAWVLVFGVQAQAVTTQRVESKDPGPVSFANDVLPLLSDRCFHCHGPDGATREADLRLDTRAGVFGDRGGYAAVVPGDLDESELWYRIQATDADQMPPADSNLALSEDERETLRRWIEQGAKWEQHWAFEAPKPVQVEELDDPWVRHPIDAFVLRGLTARGMKPNQTADPASLLRRVTLDLTGLPPTEAEREAFLADPSDEAYAAVVDRLLASPHYGERMAWPWLEASRYADTDGYQADPTRTAWPWRDWLVTALNENKPFDELTVEMLAGDLLLDATLEQRLATGFLRNNAHNGEGGRIPEETRVENVFDRTETVATVWMGLTFECARCHDHKYDPLPQRDYYALSAFFNQSSESGAGRRNGVLAPSMTIPRPGDRAEVERLESRIDALEARLFADDPATEADERAWIRRERTNLLEWSASLEPLTRSIAERAGPFVREDGDANRMLDTEFAPESDKQFAGWREAPALVDGESLALPTGEFTTYFRQRIEAPSARRLRLSLGSDDAIKVWCNGEEVLRADVRRGVAPDQESVVVDLRAGSNELVLKIVNTGGRGGVYLRFDGQTRSGLDVEEAAALAVADEQRDAEQWRRVKSLYRRSHVEGWIEQKAELDRLQAQSRALSRRQLRVSVMDELPVDRRRTTYVLERGVYNQPGAVVEAGTPSFLPPLPETEKADRLALARWLVSGQHPLTARVAVNRAWQTFFGRGLVATPEDFGRQGERPSHPQLLDWLAESFVDSGWDMKALHRAIVLSATYRQSAAATAESFRADPTNVALGRSPRTRRPAWMLRDQALALSGRLVRRRGGEPVRPYQPAGVWDEATFGTIKYQQGMGDELYRRSLYTFWRRIVGPTVLFDTPARQACVVRPSSTNTPLHALTTLNETGFVEAARGLAERSIARFQADPDTAWRERIAWMFAEATGRAPTADELALLNRRFDSASARFREDPKDAEALLGVGAAPAPDGVPADALAAATVIASILLNLDEVLTRS